MTPLFIKEIPTVPEIDLSEEELKRLLGEFSSFDTYYVASAAIKERKDFFEGLWGLYEPYADENFISQAKISFHQKTWEMYLGSVFLKNDFTLARAGTNAPDIKIGFPAKPTIWVECVAPEKGDEEDRVLPLKLNEFQSLTEENRILRIAQSFKGKSDKFTRYINDGIIGNNEPRIIAINECFDYPGRPPLLTVKALFSMGHPTFHLDQETGKTAYSGYSLRDKITKKSGAEVVLGQFTNDQYKHISAAICSNKNVLNLSDIFDYQKRGCDLILNQFAEVPLSPGTFPFMTEYWKEGDKIHWRGSCEATEL